MKLKEEVDSYKGIRESGSEQSQGKHGEITERKKGGRESEGRVKSTFFVKLGEVMREFKKQILMILLVYKESFLNTTETNTNSSLPSVFMSLLQDFKDVYAEDIPQGLPPIRGIEHQIDFIPGAIIPN